MKFYSLKYVSSQSHPGLQKMWKITIIDKYRGDKGLVAHEVFHVAQWYACLMLTLLLAGVLGYLAQPYWYALAVAAPWTHHGLYRTKPYKRLSEAMATRIQLRYGNYTGRQWAVKWLKDMGISDKWAKWWTRA